jgi:hypothetical protein
MPDFGQTKIARQRISLYEAGNRANLLIISFEVNRNTTSEPTQACILCIPKVLVPAVPDMSVKRSV